MVRYQGEKMSKSLGNLVFVSELVKEWDPMAVRLALLSQDHGADWEWTDSLLVDGAARLERWRAAGAGDGALEDVRAVLDNNLDFPRALAAVDRSASAGAGVGQAATLLGVRLS
jgi:L-cysteine:1D-myo-inositol 2-amino-2-deoxy-alpha-D-glucopyranoside ligase